MKRSLQNNHFGKNIFILGLLLKKIKDPLDVISGAFILEVRKNFSELRNVCSTCLINKDLG